MSSQYGQLRPTNGWEWLVSLGYPSKFQRVSSLCSLLHRRLSTEVNQTLHDVWPSPELVQYAYIFGGSCPLKRNSARCKIHFASKSCVLVYSGSVTACHLSSRREPNFAAWYTRNGITEHLLLVIFNRGRHLYCEGGHDVGHGLTF